MSWVVAAYGLYRVCWFMSRVDQVWLLSMFVLGIVSLRISEWITTKVRPLSHLMAFHRFLFAWKHLAGNHYLRHVASNAS